MTDDPARWSKLDIKLNKSLELNVRQRKDLEDIFEYFDQDGMGLIKPQCLKIAFRALGFEPSPSEMKKTISEIELQKDGALSYTEFLDLMTKKMTEQEDEKKVIQMFRVLNPTNADGIVLQDLKSAAEQLNIDICNEELQEMIEEGDIANKGYVNLSDFKYIMERFYKMQSKDVAWCFKYPKKFDYYTTCRRVTRDYFGDKDEDDASETSLEESFAEQPFKKSRSVKLAQDIFKTSKKSTVAADNEISDLKIEDL